MNIPENFSTPDESTESSTDELLARLMRAGWIVRFQVTILEYGAKAGFIVFERVEPSGLAVSEQIDALKHGTAPDKINWTIDIFDPPTIHKALRKFSHSFLSPAPPPK